MRRIAPLLLMFCCAMAAAQTQLKVKMFPGAQSLPALAAVQQGMFERQGLKVEILFTANSDEQRAGLAKGEFEIAQAAVDNAVAMVELAKEDVVIVTGGDSSMNEFIVQPDVRSFKDLKGHTLLVDALNTAYALQLKKILLMNGLKADVDYKLNPIGGTGLRLRGMKENKEYKAAMLNLPFSLDAKAAGLKSLGKATDLIGPYQANGTFVLRSWGQSHRELLERYIAGLIEGTRWAMAPANKEASVKILSERLKVSTENAAKTWELMTDPKFGIAKDARFDMQGFRNVLALRAEIEGSWGGKAPPPDRYIDLSYYEGAEKRLAR
ncbi:MAG TPA: ABC transporter substrate-binding protein [Burkholderiales bacterium]|jgi:ABC-type nitrate/sulfonate/bicarbonate transport system substrate-binding protein|nr:ABC transporter substrate-binding protein [Burkholderiales bacterium]